MLVALVLAVLLGIGLYELLRDPDLPLRCADHWDSSSIGTQGACSHHGGVVGGNDPTPWWKQWLAIGGGLASFGVFTWLLQMIPMPKPDPYAHYQDDASLVIRAAMKQGKDVRFTYTKEGGEPETRRVTPLDLMFLKPGVYTSRCLVGYCHDRSAKRTFALKRIVAIEPIDAVR